LNATTKINLDPTIIHPVIRNEGQFRRHVIGQMAHAAQCTHIESHETAAGVPDLNIYVQGRDVWIELKVLSDHKRPIMRPSQKRWHVDRWEHGGLSWVVAYDIDNDEVLVIPGHIAAGLGTSIALWRTSGAKHPIDDIGYVFKILAKRVRNGK
jgi:hypothetical protein